MSLYGVRVIRLLQHAPKTDWIADEDEEESGVEREGWETMSLDGQQVGIKTSAIEEKCQAFETLVIYVSTLGARFAPYLQQSLELVLPGLKFLFHEGVREACAMCVLTLINSNLCLFILGSSQCSSSAASNPAP